MPQGKRKQKKYGRIWSDKNRREGERFEADEDEEGVDISLHRGMSCIAKGKGFLVNIGHDGAFVKATFTPGTILFPQDLVQFTVVAEGRLCGFAAKAHIRFKPDEKRRVVGKDGAVDLNLAFCEVDEESQRTFTRWRGYGENARHAVGLRRRQWR